MMRMILWPRIFRVSVADFSRMSFQKKIIYVLLCLGCATISFNVAAIAAVLPLMAKELQVSDIVIARIIPFYMVPYGISALVYAPLTRRLSYRWVVGLAMVIYSLACFMCSIASDFVWLAAGRVLMGIAGASVIPLGLMLIGEFFSKKIRGRLVGIFFGMSFVASLIGILCGGLFHWRWLFYIPGGMSILLSILYCVGSLSILDRRHHVPIQYLRIFAKSYIREVFIFIFLISFLYHGIHNWFGVYLDRVYGMEKITVSGFFVAMSIAGFLGQVIGGVISDKWDRKVSCYGGILGLGVGAMLLAGMYRPSILMGIMCFFAMAWTMGHNGISTVLTDFPDEDRPAVSSLNSAVRFISGGIGFYLSGFLVEKSFGLTFLLFGCLILLLSLYIKRINI